MNQRFFLHILLLVSIFSFCELYCQYHHSQTGHIVTSELMDNEDQEVDIGEEAPKKATFSESWGKVLSFDWTSLSKDDAYNIGMSIAAIGTAYCVWRYFPTRDNQVGYSPYRRSSQKQADFETQRQWRDFARQKKETDDFFSKMKNDEFYQFKQYAHKMPDLSKQMQETQKILEQNQERLREFQLSQMRPYLNQNSKVVFKGSLP